MQNLQGPLFALLLAGCGHVTLAVTPPDAPYSQRVKAFDELRPASRKVEKLLTWTNQDLYESTECITLGNGQQVQHPIDLLPAVLPTSLTAKRILDLRKRDTRWTVWGFLAVGSMLTGASLMMGSLFLPSSSGGSSAPLLWSGLVMAVVGTLSSVNLGALLVGNTAPDRERIFTSYEADLRESLRLDAPDPAEAESPVTPKVASPAPEAADAPVPETPVESPPAAIPAAAPADSAIRSPLRPVPPRP